MATHQPSILRTYYLLAKPGIIYGNAIAAIGGFLLASRGHNNLGLFVAMLVGLALVIGSACVFNNYIDRGIDKKMARTKQRALVQGVVSGPSALAYGTVLGLLGIFTLWAGTNTLALSVALVGFVDYVVLYGIAKRHSVWGTVVGSVAGAVPPVVGYTAVTGHLDPAAWLLFFIMVCWQMPHFYAIAMFRYDDYAAARLPVLPVKKGMGTTKVQIMAYIAAYTVAAALLTAWHYTGLVYLGVMLLVSAVWFGKGALGFKAADEKVWARGMFGYSLIVMVTFSLMISVGAILP